MLDANDIAVKDEPGIDTEDHRQAPNLVGLRLGPSISSCSNCKMAQNTISSLIILSVVFEVNMESRKNAVGAANFIYALNFRFLHTH